MANHAETGRHIFQLFGHVFAQVAQSAAAGWTCVSARRIDLFLTRQVIRQRPAHRLPAWRPIRFGHFPLCLGFVCLQVFQLQFKLLNLVVELFGLAAELHAPQFGNHQFEMFDLGSTRVQLY